MWAILVADVFQRYVPLSGAVLDLGCGWGEFINQVRAERRYGMDLNPATRSQLVPAVVHIEQDCSVRWPFDTGALDTVFTSNFFEHLPDKGCLERTLAEAFRCLRPGGRLVCLGPNIKYLPGAYWDFWDHHIPLTEESLKEVLEITGFRTERCVPRFLPYTVSQGFQPPLMLLWPYLRMPFIWPIFGRQFLLVSVHP